MKKLFGSAPKQVPSQQQQISGYGALPGFAQETYGKMNDLVNQMLDNPNAYFAPMGLTKEELAAQSMINAATDPKALAQSIEGFMNPYRDIVFDDINRSFERGPLQQFQQGLDAAGAFGSSRQNQGMYDLGRAQIDGLNRASSDFYNTAYGMRQQSIADLLGFGGLNRAIDFDIKQALPNALGFGSGIISPLLSGSQGTTTGGYTTSGQEGLVSQAGKIASLLSIFSDRRLKKNIKKVGFRKGLNVYEFEYKHEPGVYRGFMADEVERLYPEAVGMKSGYKTVNYGMIK